AGGSCAALGRTEASVLAGPRRSSCQLNGVWRCPTSSGGHPRSDQVHGSPQAVALTSFQDLDPPGTAQTLARVFQPAGDVSALNSVGQGVTETLHLHDPLPGAFAQRTAGFPPRDRADGEAGHAGETRTRHPQPGANVDHKLGRWRTLLSRLRL